MKIQPIPPTTVNRRHGSLLSYPVYAFYFLTIAVSWAGAFCLVARYVFRSEHIPKFSGLMMFSVMLLGPSLAGLFMTWLTQDSSGVKERFHRMTIWRFSWHWYAPARTDDPSDDEVDINCEEG